MVDPLIIRTERTLPWLRRSLLGMYRWAPAGLAVLATGLIVLAGISISGGQGRWLDYVPLYIGAIAFAIVLPWRTHVIARKLFRMAQSHGSPVYTVDAETLRNTNGPFTTEVAWRSVHRVCVSPQAIYIFTTKNGAWLMGRGDHETRLFSLARSAGVPVVGV